MLSDMMLVRMLAEERKQPIQLPETPPRVDPKILLKSLD